MATALALSVAGVPAHAGDAGLPDTFIERLSSTLAHRIEGDRSGACVQAARVDLTSSTALQVGAYCAGPRLDKPALGDARFEIGSLSKVLVGLLAAEMVQRGEVSLDDPLATLLPPDAPVTPGEVPAVTLRDLLAHRAGLPPLPPGFRPANPFDPYADLSAAVVYGRLAQLPSVQTSAAPASRYAYSHWGYLLLSDLLAQRAGVPFDRLLHERVLRPLALTQTAVAGAGAAPRGRMSNGRPATPWQAPARFAGANGMVSTLDDLVNLARALLGDVPEDTPPSLRRALLRAQQPLAEGTGAVDPGWGWQIVKRDDGARVWLHYGLTGGYAAALALDPARQRAGVALADAAIGIDDLALRLVDETQRLQLPAKTVALDLPLAHAHVGRYELAPGFTLNVTLDQGRLFAQAGQQPRFELLQDSRGEYFATVADIVLRFHRNGAGRTEGLTLIQGGVARAAPRLRAR